jgi:hypothetical protein
VSLARPDRVDPRPYVHPAILELARAIGRSGGWRVTSIYRPGSRNHEAGVALDAAPLTHQSGGMGLPTARRLLAFAKAALPAYCWLANAELDHVHLQLAKRDAISMNLPGGTRAWHPDTNKEIPMNDIVLDNQGYGDIDHDSQSPIVLTVGDLEGGDIAMGDLAMGDLSVAPSAFYAAGDLEQGATKRRRVPIHHMVRGLQSGKPGFQHAFSQLSHAQQAQVRGLTHVANANKARLTSYEQVSHGCVIRSTTVGSYNKMGSAEVDAARVRLWDLPYFDPQVVSFTYNAPNYDLDVNAALATLSGVSSGSPLYMGGLIIFSASTLNVIPEQSISVTRTLSAITPKPQINTATITLARAVYSSRYFFFNAAIQAGRPRLTIPTLTNVASAAVNTIRVSGLPANYTVQFAFIQPGDSLIDAYIGAISKI